jgi:putative protease
MFIENPRDNSKYHAVDQSNAISVVQIQEVEQNLNDEKQLINASVDDKIKHLTIDKIPLTLSISGKLDQPLTLTVTTKELSQQQPFIDAEDSDKGIEIKSFELKSQSNLVKSGKLSIDRETVEKRFKSFNNAHFNLIEICTQALEDGLSVPFKELTVLKNQAAFLLNNSKPVIAEVELPKLIKHPKVTTTTDAKAELSILICDESDVGLASLTSADIYFKLPEAYKRGCTKYVGFLKENPRLIPWFSSVLIGKDYDVAVNILEQVRPELIVTNNTGIAYEANRLGIQWIAGPFLNTTNSYALLAMQEGFDCKGAFISNEINRQQIRNIARPENFKLFYSIYHPILLMASRQCFFQQSVGCEKPRIDNGCMLSCGKSTSITNLKGVSFAIDKQKAGYPSIYNQDQFLNTEIIEDLSDLFDGFMIDLTNIGSGDKEMPEKALLITQFEELLKGNSTVPETLNIMVPESTDSQYHTGL